jgi:hypothetical protein
MCGIFGQISSNVINRKDLNVLAMHARQRGKDSSGLVHNNIGTYNIVRADYDIKKLMSKEKISRSRFAMGHSRLVTNGQSDNQPVYRDGIFVIHNGIIVNDNDIWEILDNKRQYEIDTEVIIGIVLDHIEKHSELDSLASKIFKLCDGTISAVIGFPYLGKALLLSNNGSLYYGYKKLDFYFSSESFPLNQIECTEITQISNSNIIVDLPKGDIIKVEDKKNRRKDNLIPKLNYDSEEEKFLEFYKPDIKRCTKCILPETFPHISFDEHGVCNYCNNYKSLNANKAKADILKIVEKYRNEGSAECIVPFSGGRDSCYALHIIVNELKLKPITYTYDWGMVTDLARRNISRMCSRLGVENIIVAADITKKRKNIRKNLIAWLKSPHLGMVSILTAGDKHFFKYIESVKKQTGVNLNLWGTNPLETTHFKSGFLGIKPNFEELKVYTTGFRKQLRYHSLRFKAMLKSLGYFNSSLFDTLSGEYYRSFINRNDYFHIFDYYLWKEDEVDKVLESYEFEKAPDTNTTWRIGDGTAAFYNYIYYTVAGFTEHDTFRSNQIREGHINREEALKLVNDENRPRYQNIRWYLDALNIDYKYVIKTINKIPKLYNYIASEVQNEDKRGDS